MSVRMDSGELPIEKKLCAVELLSALVGKYIWAGSIGGVVCLSKWYMVFFVLPDYEPLVKRH